MTLYDYYSDQQQIWLGLTILAVLCVALTGALVLVLVKAIRPLAARVNELDQALRDLP